MDGLQRFWYMAFTQAILLLSVGGFAMVLRWIGLEPGAIVAFCAFAIGIFSLCFAVAAGGE